MLSLVIKEDKSLGGLNKFSAHEPAQRDEVLVAFERKLIDALL